MAEENPSRGYTRIQGALKNVGQTHVLSASVLNGRCDRCVPESQG
jgi:hypothetical protein